LYAWDCGDDGVVDADGVTATLRSLFSLFKGFMGQRRKGIDLIYLTSTAPTAAPRNEAVLAFLQTLRAENATCTGRIVEVDDLAEVEVAAAAELRIQTAHGAIRYAGGVRSVRQLVAHDRSTLTSSGFDPRGPFIITGGAGKIGLHIADMLVRQHQVSVALVGRSPLDATRSRAVDQIRSGSARAHYYTADIAVVDQLGRAIEEIHRTLGPIRGAVHAAAATRDSFFVNKSLKELQSVLRAKVDGVVNLDYLLRDEPLELFALCSAMAAVMGNPGQADYAAANGFLDGFAIYREALRSEGARRGKTVSINWPLWAGTGGLTVPDYVEAEFRKQGFVPLEADDGLRVLRHATMGAESRVAAVAGMRPAIDRLVNWLRSGETPYGTQPAS
jgi:NAD(P)-dependent dehydrogenase (short-subunit alcohol dehydrogenase family)